MAMAVKMGVNSVESMETKMDASMDILWGVETVVLWADTSVGYSAAAWGIPMAFYLVVTTDKPLGTTRVARMAVLRVALMADRSVMPMAAERVVGLAAWMDARWASLEVAAMAALWAPLMADHSVEQMAAQRAVCSAAWTAATTDTP